MKCPGQDSRYWRPGAIFDVKCPNCGEMIEFFKDDSRRKCPGCGENVPNPEIDFGCAAYCPYAEHCLGSAAADKAGDGKLKLLKGKMLKEIRSLYQNNSKHVARASSFLELCEELGKKEGADLGLVLLAGFSLLFLPEDVSRQDMSEIQIKVQKVLERIGAEEQQARDALELLLQGTAGNSLSGQAKQNWNVIKDALTIAEFQIQGTDDWKELSDKLATDSGRQLAAHKAASG